jgi:RimJ/RimL family protein N-acetyltransferase
MPAVTHPWPLFDLRVRTRRLELRYPTDDDLVALLEVARAGIHDPAEMPFDVPWTDLQDAAFDHGFMRFFWGARASWAPHAWSLPLAVFVDRQPVGVQEVSATDFATRRTVDTGSWLGRGWQRQGLGTEMRAAVLHLAFDGLGALAATSAAHADNEASRRVSEKLGYRRYGTDVVAPRGTPIVLDRYLLLREDFRPGDGPVSVEGLEGCLAMFRRDGSEP